MAILVLQLAFCVTEDKEPVHHYLIWATMHMVKNMIIRTMYSSPIPVVLHQDGKGPQCLDCSINHVVLRKETCCTSNSVYHGLNGLRSKMHFEKFI